MAVNTILTVNAGSSSVKYALYDSGMKKAEALYEMKGKGYQFTLTYKVRLNEFEKEEVQRRPISKAAFDHSCKHLLHMLEEVDLITDPKAIDAVGHRVVHGGTTFTKPTIITTGTLRKLDQISHLAPLHNPVQIALIRALRKSLPKATHIAVFDTAFHSSMPEKAYHYAIPYKYEQRYGIRKYGFHGISVASCVRQLKDNYHTLPKRMVICHLGSGSSITAILDGQTFDTSMGFTPLEGIPMMTRGGDIDDGAILELFRINKSDSKNKAVKDIEQILNHDSGLLGLTGSKDMRQIITNAINNPGSKYDKGLEYFIYHIQKYIGSYYAAMGGIDALIFTGGIGTGSPYIRSRIIDGLSHLDLHLSRVNNLAEEIPSNISDEDSADIWILDPKEQEEIYLEVLATA